jgi:hypothetical protein
VKRTAIAVSMCFGMAPSAAFALDWSLRTTQIETIELNDNQFLRSSPAPSVGSYSTITANAEARTAISRFNIDADGTYRRYWGPGVEGAPSESMNYGFKGRYEQYGKSRSDREFIETSWRQQSTSFALLSDLGVVSNARGFLDRLAASGGIDRSVTARDNLSLLATSTRTIFEPSSAGTAFTDTLVRGTWRHSLNRIAALNASSEAEFLDYENTTNTRVQIYRNQIGGDATLSPVLSLRGNIGAAYLVTEGGASTLTSGATPLNASGSSSLVDWIGDAVLTYRMLKNTTLAITASQSIAPSVVGSLFKRDSVVASLSHMINNHSTLSFSASGIRQVSTTTTDYASASVTYGYSFTRDLSAQLTYRYQHRFASSGTSTIDPITGTPTVGGTGPASSNSLMLTVTNNYTVLPRGN